MKLKLKILCIILFILIFFTYITSLAFTKNNLFYDKENQLISYVLDNRKDKLTFEHIKDNFANVNNELDTKQIIGTGTSILLKNINFYIIVYGDVTSDGLVNANDALKILQSKVGDIELTKIEEIAGNVDTSNSKLNANDALRILRFASGLENTLLSANNTSEPIVTPTPTFDNITLGMKNALKQANNYISILAFSYESLIEQLKFEGYSDEEATYAVEHCNANWNEQALKSAKTYLNTMPFSYIGLVKQLEHEKFTKEQAIYGADNCNADWNEQAVKSAKNYIELMPFSKKSLISQLEFEGFTKEQAEYGANSIEY